MNQTQSTRSSGLQLFTVSVAVALALSCWPNVSQAEEVIFQKHQVVHFGDDTLSGDLSRPDGQSIYAQKNPILTRMIQIRANFRVEILKSIQNKP